MPTVGWIQETGQDRFWETGSEPNSSPLPTTYPCRYCAKVFDSIAAREQHELEHPFLNPTLFYRNRELGSSQLLITALVQPGDIDARNISRMLLNGCPLDSVVELTEALQASSKGFFNISYANEALEKTLKIELCVADEQQLSEVDHSFKMHFSKGSISDQMLASFHDSVRHCETVEGYINGLVRYLHGLKAKEHHSEITSFEAFDMRFNQAVDSLKNYNTALALAIRAVIRFNRNDFNLMRFTSGVPDLDSATAFFRGADLAITTPQSPDAQLPVDQATEFILKTLLPAYAAAGLSDLEQMISLLSKRYLSLQDTSKLNYLCFCKAVDVLDHEAITKYHRKLRYDDVFNTLIGDA
jgi:hypothetical protein